jgi:hypothetical protein
MSPLWFWRKTKTGIKMVSGGKRDGAGRKARPTSKAKGIWCSQITNEQRDFIMKWLSPEDRYGVLMVAANTASTRRGTVAILGKRSKPPRG